MEEIIKLREEIQEKQEKLLELEREFNRVSYLKEWIPKEKYIPHIKYKPLDLSFKDIITKLIKYLDVSDFIITYQYWYDTRTYTVDLSGIAVDYSPNNNIELASVINFTDPAKKLINLFEITVKEMDEDYNLIEELRWDKEFMYELSLFLQNASVDWEPSKLMDLASNYPEFCKNI